MHRTICFATFLVAHIALAGNWPQFRGLQGSGVAIDNDVPVHFGPQSNVLWKAEVPAGHSSPVIWRDKIFLTGFADEELQTFCLNGRTGRELWRRSVKPTKLERGTRNSHPATSTPCTDGETLFVYFGSFGALAYDFDGKELWRTSLPVPITQHGASSSPVLTGGVVILQRDADTDSHLLALNKRDGKMAWKTERPDARRSFSTPLVVGRAVLSTPHGEAITARRGEDTAPYQIIVPGTLRVAAYDAKDGRELWTVRGLPNEMCSSPVFGDGLIFIAGWTPGAGVATLPNFDALLERGDKNQDGKLSQAEAPPGPLKQQFVYTDADKDGLATRAEWNAISEIFSRSENVALAIRPGGSGDITKTHVAWKQTRGLPYVPTPLLYDHRLYLVRNGGLLSCFNATNGAAVFQEERIGALGDYYASPVAAGGRICVISQSGTATILAAGDELKVLARNTLGGAVLATPAISDNTLYVRTATALYAFRTAD
ncbi:MAG TPA: PQQ-binding-like beta-propeller repeat protein [Candidatus Acidoferrum sp.]|nr:PQQ-binding-like beta-propeller repeat protein [Candidatus Acidoferrum sp.]